MSKRRAKGTTRTGAIPFCMAEVTPRQSRKARWHRLFTQLAHEGDMHRDRMLLGMAPPPARRDWLGVGSILVVPS